jgi:cytoskeletal protein RodZ
MDSQLSLGDLLKKTREQKGYSLEQVASITKISIKNIRHLENNELQFLPAKTYVNGFISTYSKFLGLNPESILFEYDSFISQHYQQRSVKNSISGYAFENPTEQKHKKILSTLFAVLGVLSLIILVIVKPKLKHRHSKHLDEPTAIATPSATTATGVAMASPTATPTATPTSTSVASVGLPATPTTTPTSTPVVSAVSSAVLPTPVPSASPTPNLTPTPGTSLAAEELDKNDRLRNGSTLEESKIHHRILATALEDVMIRFKSDSKEENTLILRKGRLLSLKGEFQIYLQSSSLESLSISYNRGASIPMSDSSALTEVGNDFIIAYPLQASDIAEKNFKVRKHLPPPPPRP